MAAIRCIQCGFEATSTKEITRVVLLAGFNGQQAMKIMGSHMSDYRLSVSQMAAKALNSNSVHCPSCKCRSVWEAS